MDVTIYLLLSFLDAMTIIALAWKIYRFPFFEYFKEIILVSSVVSLVSYLIRIKFEIPGFDMAVQYILYALFFRLIQVRYFESIILAAVGYLAFTGIQFIIYPILIANGIVDTNDAQNSIGIGTYKIQVGSEIAGLTVSWLLYRFNLGYSCFSRPPQDLYINQTLKGTNLYILLTTIGAICVIFSTLYWILNYHNHIFIVLSTVIISLSLLVFLSHRKDLNYD